MIEIRLLLPGDDRTGFESGNPFLDTYFRRYAGQNQFRHRIGANYVALAGGRIAGFATVSPAEIQADKLPPGLARRLPAYPVPVLRLARLATDRRHQGRGIGESLLRYALLLAEKTSRELGCAGMVVDAKPESRAFYERYGFVALAVHDGALPGAPQTMFLSIHSIPQ